ncbi:9729_t:CDS:2, partial [Paraglomus occultum]
VRQVPRKGILDAQEDQMGNSNVSMLNLANATARLTLDGPRQWAKLTPVDRGFNEIREIKIFKDIHKIGRDSKNDTVIKDVGISRNHCVITKVTKQLERDYYETTIQKCSSNPRLWVNGVQIGYPYTMVISPGDIISFPSLELDAHVAYKFEVLLDLNSVLTNFNDKYRTLGVLGQGAFARVTCVQQLSTSRLYACKQIHTSVVRTGTNLQVSSPLAIDREIRILKTANH